MTNPLEKIDWVLLKEQKKTLVNVISYTDDIEYLDNLNGLLFLIDNIQDYAVDHLGIDENEVFDLDKED